MPDLHAAVSTNVFDHLGDGKQRALEEHRRVLKPDGRFLMAVSTPGWAMAMIANALSLAMTRRGAWRAMARRAGLRVVDEGAFNFAWFAVFEKPAAA